MHVMSDRKLNKFKYIATGMVAVLLPLGLMAAQSPAPPVVEDDDAADHVRAFDALRAGKIVPVTTILDWLETNYRGYVVEVELETEDDGAAYEVEFVTDQGNFLEFDFNATTGALIGVVGNGAEAARKVQ
jgi:uncharacterized membrane protein YkoI